MKKFKYDKMNRPLKKYLKHMNKRPGYEYDKSGPTPYSPTPESQARVDKWKAKATELMDALGDHELKDYYAARKKWLCRDETLEGDPDVHEKGPYRLVVSKHSTGKGTWAYTKGKAYKGEKLVATVYRNYSQFPFSWILGHPDGHDYLLCGEDYQGQTVIQLDTGERVDNLSVGTEKGHGFCWVRHYPSPDGTKMAVEGCHWACPYEVRIYDFADPLAAPWEELFTDYNSEDFGGWNEDGSCSVGRRFERVNLPGHRLHGKDEADLEMDDLEEIERIAAERDVVEDDLYEEVFESTTLWSPEEAT